MKKLLFITFLIPFTIYTNAQSWVAGDTTGLELSIVEQTFYPDSEVKFDIDCDGESDMTLYSTYVSDVISGVGWQLGQIKMIYSEGVEVMNSNSGKITSFDEGETVDLTGSLFNHNLDYYIVCQSNNPNGCAGTFSVDEKYIVFRKVDGDVINYIYILFSNFDYHWFTIHQIISKCENNPLDIIISSVENPVEEEPEDEEKELYCFPNPSNGILNLSIEVDAIKIYNIEGQFVLNEENVQNNIDLSQLSKGVYVVKIYKDDAEKIERIILD